MKNEQGHYPMAIIQNGSLPEQKIISGSISEMISASENGKIASPAIIIIGKVVLLREKLQEIIERSSSRIRKAAN